ncbi:MAG: pirin family protein [Acidobacteria bacterium]|nr:pirin family protein [Acidobacteriota bacterium]
MIQTIASADRHHADFGWLSARWHFSFDHYYDPNNLQWGALRVFNDDIIQPGGSFPMHGHRDMEIISVVLEGALEHTDSIGSRHVLRPGEVQVMSAGAGIRHSESNPSSSGKMRLMQIWIRPRNRGSTPRWEQRAFPDRQGKLLAVVSSGDVPGTLAIDQDATIYLSELRTGEAVEHHSAPGRKAYLFVPSGDVELNGRRLSSGDQARIDNEAELKIRALDASVLILLDLPD